MKILSWRENLEKIVDGNFPPPISVQIDPSNLCQIECIWCNTKKFRESCPQTMSTKVLLGLPKFLKEWGVKSVELTGGEPLTHPKIVEFLYLLKENGLLIGLQTNGIKLGEGEICKAVINTCDWVGVSVDAATNKLYSRTKKSLVNTFQKVINSVSILAKVRGEKRLPLVTLKFLLHHTTYGEMYQFADMAKSLGANDVHFRPVYLNNYYFKIGVRKTSEWHLREARKDFEDEDFHIYGIVHKFDRDWQRIIRFKKCYATPLTGVFAVDGIFYMCADRRGDKLLNLGKFVPFDKFLEQWGSKMHKDKIDRIASAACPRCSQCITNEIIERVVRGKEMTLDFV